MENVDKDVAAMIKSLKKYDKLVESCAPVLGMKTLGEKDEGKHNNGTTTGFAVVAKKAANEYGSKESGQRVAGAIRNKMNEAEDEDEDKDEKSDHKDNPWKKLADKDSKTTSKGGTVSKTDKGVVHKEKEKVDEGADPEVLEWMQRFSKLGNMKGYGR